MEYNCANPEFDQCESNGQCESEIYEFRFVKIDLKHRIRNVITEEVLQFDPKFEEPMNKLLFTILSDLNVEAYFGEYTSEECKIALGCDSTFIFIMESNIIGKTYNITGDIAVTFTGIVEEETS